MAKKITNSNFIFTLEYEGTDYALMNYFSDKDLEAIPDEALREAAIAAKGALEKLQTVIDGLRIDEDDEQELG